MDLDAEVAALEKSRRTLTRWGIWGTALYLGCLLGYGGIAWRDFTALSPNEVGDFLAGVFAPLAFLWLVLGYRMQALELEQNSKALRQQAEEMRNAVEQSTVQADALKSNSVYMRQDVINATRVKFEDDLCRIAADFYMVIIKSHVDGHWESFAKGDRSVFCRVALDLMYNKEYFCEKYIKVNSDIDALIRLSSQYCNMFDEFMVSLKTLECSLAYVTHYSGSVFGHLNRQMENFPIWAREA